MVVQLEASKQSPCGWDRGDIDIKHAYEARVIVMGRRGSQRARRSGTFGCEIRGFGGSVSAGTADRQVNLAGAAEQNR